MKRPQYKAVGDSGAVSAYRPAQHTKPPSLLKRILQKIGFFSDPWVASESTQMGSQAASPATYAQSLWPQRYERAQYIADNRRLILDDPRAFKSVRMFCREAVRGGFHIRVHGSSKMCKQAQVIANTLQVLMSPRKLEGWAIGMITEGDLFIQAVALDDEVKRFMRMPAAGMERNSDDADEIIDPDKAFSQIDTNTWAEVSTFPLGLMCHVRWNWIDGDKYGTPEIISVRRVGRELELAEAASLTQRMARAPIRYHWKIGDKDNGGRPEDIQKFKNDNGKVDGKQEIFDPTLVAQDYFSNAHVECEVLEGDSNTEKIDDIRYRQDKLFAGLPTPKALVGVDNDNVNRDILRDIREEWLKDTCRITEALDEVVNWALHLMFALKGIDPNLINYTIRWTTSSVESASDRIRSVIELKTADLVSIDTALTMIQEYTGIEDLDQERQAIENEILKDLRMRSEFTVPGPSSSLPSKMDKGEDAPKFR
jgi:Bacteriophage T4-like portal protein (Gp20)